MVVHCSISQPGHIVFLLKLGSESFKFKFKLLIINQMNSKKDSKRIKQKHQQTYFSPAPKRSNNDPEANPLNLRDLSPFRPIYGSSQAPPNVHFSNTELTIIETPAQTAPRGLYLEQIEQGLHSISGIINWENQNYEQSDNYEEDSEILQISEDDSQKSTKKVTEENPEKVEEKVANHIFRTAEPKQKKQNNKKASQATIAPTTTKKVFCNCKKTKCLKLYCDCFRINQTCEGCNCVGCHNLPSYEEERNNSMLTLMDRNPEAFKPKIDQQQHAKGCHCRKSNCFKKYCQCYQAGLKCGSNCKCEDCKNKGCDHEDKKDGNSSLNYLIVNIQTLMNEDNKQTKGKREKNVEEKIKV